MLIFVYTSGVYTETVGIQLFDEFCWDYTTKRAISNTAKLSVFKSAFFPILTYGPGSWIMTERILFQVQGQRWKFCEKVRNCEIREALNVEPLSRIDRSPPTIVCPRVQNSPRKTGEASLAGCTHEKAAQRSIK